MHDQIRFVDDASGTLHLALEGRRGVYTPDTDPEACAAALDAWLAAREEGRTLSSLAVYSAQVHCADLAPVIRVLAARRPAFHSVSLGAVMFPDFARGDHVPEDLDRDGSSWHLAIDDLSGLLLALPALEHLVVQARQLGSYFPDANGYAAPMLRSLVLRAEAPSPEVFAALGKAVFPALETLELWFPAYGYGYGGTAADLAPMLNSAQAPALRHLALVGDVGDALVDVLADSAALPRLAALDLSHGTIGDAGAARLRDRWSSFAYLKHLRLTGNAISPALVSALRGLGGRAVDSAWQRCSDDEIYRCDPPAISLFQGLLDHWHGGTWCSD